MYKYLFTIKLFNNNYLIYFNSQLKKKNSVLS